MQEVALSFLLNVMPDFLKIKKRKDFVRVAQVGAKVVTTSVIVQAALSLCPQEIAPHFGFTTTKRIGHAVVRNRARRRMRAAVREMFVAESLNNVEYVLIGRHNTADCDFEVLRRDVRYAFRKVNRLLSGDKKDENIQMSDHCSD